MDDIIVRAYTEKDLPPSASGSCSSTPWLP